MSIAVIVCTCDRYHRLTDCLAALAEQRGSIRGCAIIVVDNSTDADERQRFLSSKPRRRGMRLVISGRPGLSHARNLGTAQTDADLVAFIDDDAVPEPDWLAELQATFASTPLAVVVGGPVEPIWPDRRPDWAGSWADGFFSIVDRGPVERDLAAGEWLAGTNLAFRRKALLDAGGFDEALGRRPGVLLGNEEVAVVDALRRAGGTVRYNPRARVRHAIDATRVTQAWLRRRVTWQAVSDLMASHGEAAGVAALWRRIGGFLGALPPECRNFVGLTRDFDDPDMVQAQGEAIAAVVQLLAGHGCSVERALLAA